MMTTDTADRRIAIGDAWVLARWYARPSPRQPLVTIVWKSREERWARAVVAALLMAWSLLAAVNV